MAKAITAPKGPPTKPLAPAAASPAQNPQRAALASMFAGVASATERKDNYVTPGQYTFELVKCTILTTREQRKGFLFELRVTSAKAVTMESDAGPVLVPAGNEPGEVVSHMVMLDRGETAMRDVKGMCAALLGKPFADVTPDDVAGCVDNEELIGAVLGAKAYTVTTKGKGLPFTRVEYRAAGDNASDEG